MNVWMFTLALAVLPLPLFAQSEPDTDPNFSHSVETAKKPWTQRAFRNHPKDFQFAIVTDRTGGMRPGVFPRAVKKINELQPEFVITVGDLIAGGGRQRDEKEIRRQWAEFNGFVDTFDMPFFYLPGNHDVSNEVMDKIWDEQFGVRYYTFVYKDVLFLCLNTQDGAGSRPFLGKKQIAWAQAELAKHADVRWTMVFIHQPLWLSEEGFRRNRGGKVVLEKTATGWPLIEAALQGRKHSVYAGHVHRYAKYERNEANYYTLGTTGGGSALRGNPFGEFDHATWITMTDAGPRMLNLTLDGMLAEDVTTEAHQTFWRGLRLTGDFDQSYPFTNQVVTLPLKNSFKGLLSGRVQWLLPASDNWEIQPTRTEVNLKPGEIIELEFTMNHRGDVSTFLPLPRLQAHFHADKDGFHLERGIYMPFDMMAHAKKHPIKATASRAKVAPVIDGQLDDFAWQGAPSIRRLVPMKADGYALVATDVWLRHDDRSFYVGVRCDEPRVPMMRTEITERDGEVWLDDAIEVLVDANRDKKTYRHFAVNANGVFYDGRQRDAAWNSRATASTARNPDGWTAEFAIPFEALGAKPADDEDTWGLQIARHRPREERNTTQWAPTFWYGNYVPSLFGQLRLEAEDPMEQLPPSRDRK